VVRLEDNMKNSIINTFLMYCSSFREIADFIKKKSTSVGNFHEPFPVVSGVGESTFFVAKEF
jgi:hypothetical protein